MRLLGVFLAVVFLAGCGVEAAETEDVLMQWKAPKGCKAGFLKIDERAEGVVIAPVIVCPVDV